MKLNKQDKEDLMQVYNSWWNSYLTGDVKTYDSFLDEEFRFVGSTNNEEFLSKKDTTDFFDATADQLAGKAELRNTIRKIEVLGNGLVLITDLADAYVVGEPEWVFYSRFRFTCLLRKTENGWRFIYQHFSAPDTKAQKGETLGLKQISKENQELRDAIKRRTVELEHKNRELEIETALERVRARTMAMQKGEEVKDVVVLLYKELIKLGVTNFATCGYVEINEKTNKQETWVTNPGGDSLGLFYLPLTGDVLFDERYEAWKKQQMVFHQTVAGKKRREHLEYAITTFNSKEAEEMVLNQFPDPTVFYCFNFSHGYLHLVSGSKLKEEEESLLARFTRVFQQTYTRFLDLQKAEARAREAQIELALERVRARTMAMQQSEELGGVATVLFKELNLLVENLWTCGFVLCEKNRGDDEWWVSTNEGFIPAFYLPNTVDVTHENMHKAWESGETYHTEQLEGKALQEHYDWLMNIPASKKIFEVMTANGISLPTWQKLHGAFFSYGYLVMITQVPCPEEAIFKRFAQVFDQTYTRFLDLQKAEAQAREAQIEAALEKVRSHSIGMQKSEELREVIQVIHDQLIHLNFEIDAAGFTLDYHQNNDWNIWIANKSSSLPSLMFIPYIEHPQFNYYKSAKEKGLDFLANTLSFEEKNSIFNYMFGFMGDYPKTEKDEVLRKPGLAISQAFLKNISLWIYNLEAIPYSKEDNNTLMRFAKVFQQTYTRFLDLQKAEAQAREAQIEAALEKVRSRSLAMHTANELGDVVAVIVEKLKDLDVVLDANGVVLCTYFQDSKDVLHWIASSDFTFAGSYLLPYFDHPIFNDSWQSKESGAEYFSKAYSVELKNSFFEYAFEHSDYRLFPDDFKQWVFQNDQHILSFAWRKNSAILIPSHTGVLPTEEDVVILKRFAKVFEQSYVRFLDLQKAEAQAREAQVELALERIRVQATTMTESSDLLDIVVTMRTEFVSLGHEAHYFWHMRYLPEIYEKAMTSGDGTRIGMVMSLPRHMHGDIKLLADWEKSDEPTVVFAMDTETAVEYIHKMITLGDFKQVDPNAPTLDDIRHIGGLTFIMARTTYGEIGFSLPGTLPNPPKEDLDTLVRFASVFDLAYRRFEDLKAAEAQAQEAQIEAALERVRSRSMAMHKSEELADLSFELVKQIQALGVPTWFCAFNIYDDDQKGSLEWGSNSEGTYPSYRTPREGIFLRYYEAGQKGETFLVNEIGENECAAHYDYLCSLPGVGEQLLKIRDTGIPFPTSQIDHVAYFKYGYILFITFEPAADAHEVFKRFANVFEQTYTRFLDLKKAEKQAREAQIETALERVRARAMAMQQPEDLKEVAQVLRHEMGLLGVEELETSSIYINDENTHIAECWYAIKDVRKTKKKLVTDHFAIDLNDTRVGREMLKFNKSNKKQISIVMTGESRIEWIRYCEEKSIPFRGYYGDVIPDRTYHLYKFSHGSIGAATPGDFSDENWGLLRRVASVFSLAYSRFKDLTQARIDLLRLKEEKKRAEDALSNLKSTQTQLIHAEKMASLGELTAGIAHEIQNPLNFVNNFSDVSVDLIEEMDEEMTLGNTDEVKDIASDLKQNLEKIHHHGKRASFIVQGMLEHSRTNPGDKKPTDINVLADEFLRLSYHGLRAKDKSFNAEFITEFDDDLPEIDVIPQDFGRVLLNLVNNAFYACAERSRSTVAEKQKVQKENYKPAVLVKTQKIGDNVEIRVKDNGNGIPNDVLKKIFQPFFTTKPTGEGTGLGLSMSYDIITKGHGGKLEVETKEGEGTIFLISIPIKS